MTKTKTTTTTNKQSFQHTNTKSTGFQIDTKIKNTIRKHWFTHGKLHKVCCTWKQLPN